MTNGNEMGIKPHKINGCIPKTSLMLGEALELLEAIHIGVLAEYDCAWGGTMAPTKGLNSLIESIKKEKEVRENEENYTARTQKPGTGKKEN